MLSSRLYEGGPVRKGRRQRQSSDECAVWVQKERGQCGGKARSEGAKGEWGKVKLLLSLVVTEELGTFFEGSGRSVRDSKWQSERVLFNFIRRTPLPMCRAWTAGQPAQGWEVAVGIRGETLRL